MSEINTEIDRSVVVPGDTVCWRNRRNIPSWGLVEYTTPEFVKVMLHIAGGSHGRYEIRWEKVTRHFPGREEYDRRAG